MGFGVGSSEGIFVAQEVLEIMMALDSAKGIVLNVHEKKRGLTAGHGESPYPRCLPLRGSEVVEPVVKLWGVHVLCDGRQVLDGVFQQQVPSLFL